MKTIYKVTVEHDEIINPDNIVEVTEYVLQQAINNDSKMLPYLEIYLLNMVITLGHISACHMEIVRKNLNNENITPEDAKTLSSAIKDLGALSINTLALITREKQ